MTTEAGELLAGAYLQVCKGCELVAYNVYLNSPGRKGMGEIDVIGFDFSRRKVYLCEVVTHLEGTDYGKGPAATLKRIKAKLTRIRRFASAHLRAYRIEVVFWAPKVPRGILSSGLRSLGIELAINQEYGRRILELRSRAGATAKDYGNTAFRVLQVLARMKTPSRKGGGHQLNLGGRRTRP